MAKRRSQVPFLFLFLFPPPPLAPPFPFYHYVVVEYITHSGNRQLRNSEAGEGLGLASLLLCTSRTRSFLPTCCFWAPVFFSILGRTGNSCFLTQRIPHIFLETMMKAHSVYSALSLSLINPAPLFHVYRDSFQTCHYLGGYQGWKMLYGGIPPTASWLPFGAVQ